MGFLAKLIGKGASREEWISITTVLAKDLEILGDNSFQRFVRMVEDLSTNDSFKEKEPGFSVVHRTLGGEADLAIKAYELMSVSTALQRYHYIPKSKGTDFSTLLWSQVCGTKLKEVIKQAGVYYDFVKTDEDKLPGRVGLDITTYISGGNKAVVIIVPLLTAEVLTLGGLVQACVAAEFGDKSTAQDIESKLIKFRAKL